jgi:hypothetical protein
VAGSLSRPQWWRRQAQEHTDEQQQPPDPHSIRRSRDPPEGSDRNAKARWHEVGAAWTHRDGEGFDVLITPGISISGRLVIRTRREQTD